jgi:hypothetical protein
MATLTGASLPQRGVSWHAHEHSTTLTRRPFPDPIVCGQLACFPLRQASNSLGFIWIS